jgi:hypothetical protein
MKNKFNNNIRHPDYNFVYMQQAWTILLNFVPPFGVRTLLLLLKFLRYDVNMS